MVNRVAVGRHEAVDMVDWEAHRFVDISYRWHHMMVGCTRISVCVDMSVWVEEAVATVMMDVSQGYGMVMDRGVAVMRHGMVDRSVTVGNHMVNS